MRLFIVMLPREEYYGDGYQGNIGIFKDKQDAHKAKSKFNLSLIQEHRRRYGKFTIDNAKSFVDHEFVRVEEYNKERK